METKETAFSRIIREQRSTIYTICYMFSKDEDEVSDLFQEVTINLWKGFDRFEGRSDVKTWIYRVALNTCISYDRKKKKHKDSRLDININLFDESNEDNRQTQMLYKRINQLGPFDRAIILLWLENIPYDEIGAIVGISAKNVSVRLVRIREQLKQMNDNK